MRGRGDKRRSRKYTLGKTRIRRDGDEGERKIKVRRKKEEKLLQRRGEEERRTGLWAMCLP